MLILLNAKCEIDSVLKPVCNFLICVFMENIYKHFPEYLMIYINLLHYAYILFLNKWLIPHAHCKHLVNLWD